MKQNNRLISVGKLVIKILLAVACLYFFICSLDLLASAFRLLAGRNASAVFTKSDLLQNPIVGLMLGVLATVLVQSSSTTTSIIVGMVASGILPVQSAIPMVMGANIGTSVTNTIVSITQIGNREEFERAFACAVVHDIFNWLTVIVFLPVEVITGFLYRTTEAIVDSLSLSKRDKPPDILKAITKPVTKSIVQIDKKILNGWSLGQPEYENVTSLLKKKCERNVTELSSPVVVVEGEQPYRVEKYGCGYLFADSGFSDSTLGLILLFISLFVLCFCLVILVKILNSLMKEKMAGVITKALNADFPLIPWLTGYIAMLIGLGVTFLVQSSSVFTSTLTPLVGAGLFTLERAYPLTLGSNIGTTTTGLLAALASDASTLKNALQIALCHLFFNISGILVYYPVPFMRFPIPLAKMMGRTVAKYRWFAIFYLIVMFFLFPLFIFGLSLLGGIAFFAIFIPIFTVCLIIALINILQAKKPHWLPKILQDWSFLPEMLHSFEPYDKIISKLNFCSSRFQKSETQKEWEQESAKSKEAKKGSVAIEMKSPK